MNIYILEDDLSQQVYLEKLIKQILSQKNRQNDNVKSFEQPEDLINTVKEKGNHQLFFLDIELGQNDILQIPFEKILFIETSSESHHIT
ncbi:hypothetical protein [Streptococcus pseudoporcinus]|uniref:Response regulator family protein n=1 Tax=Streptococcus pseudoporcinus LQ 940-04 TaxID=875093 RepID=G5KB54_9STRE|nr:hypothetical protein [Streptococcus pseudoporcinus]EFR43460.1 response regulator [Streptococcus pseudoporcinus SPIN 20026]EHI64444.1 response regulator family protein [Streptococcus pseudoporcinus LQ 940-04]VEF94430.1 response regulator protein [Streptococcus pseudoporcinus]